MTDCNARRARAKRPMPLWVDAFIRDTPHLQADEIGAYMMLLAAMWTRESCDLPDDDSRLAKIARVSLRLWRSRIGPALRPFFAVEDGALVSPRLRREAEWTEESLAKQSARRRRDDTEADPPRTSRAEEGVMRSQKVGLMHSRENAEKSAKAMKSLEPTKSADHPRYPPTQQPTTYKIYGGGGHTRARARPVFDSPEKPKPPPDPTFRERLLEAMGLDPSGLTGPTGRIIGTQADMQEARLWLGLGLTEDEIVARVAEVMAAKRDGPPGSFRYFRAPMERLAALKAAPPLETATPSNPKGAPHAGRTPRAPAAVPRAERIAAAQQRAQDICLAAALGGAGAPGPLGRPRPRDPRDVLDGGGRA